MATTSTTETQNFDINALQTTNTANVDNQNFQNIDFKSAENVTTTPSFDLSTVNTSSTLDTAQNFNINAFQTSTTTTNVDTTAQNVTTTPSFDLNALGTTSTTEAQNFNVNAFQTTSSNPTPSFDLNAFQTTSTTNVNDLRTAASFNQASDSSNLISQYAKGIPSEGATFGEYQTTTTINGVQSKFYQWSSI